MISLLKIKGYKEKKIMGAHHKLLVLLKTCLFQIEQEFCMDTKDKKHSEIKKELVAMLHIHLAS